MPVASAKVELVILLKRLKAPDSRRKTSKTANSDGLFTSRTAMDLIIKGINGNTKRLSVDCNATVDDLKLLISQHFGVEPFQQRLSANNGLRINLDENSRSLSSYGLHSGSVVAFIVTIPGPIQVFVRNEKGITSTYDVDPNETVNQLQQKIFNKERVPVDQQRLIFNGIQLESGSMLKDYDITNQSTIYMTLRLRGG